MLGNKKEGESIQLFILALTEKAQHPVGIDPQPRDLPCVSSAAALRPFQQIFFFSKHRLSKKIGKSL